ncbi:hypothetical protein [Tenacibaculum xiamenense]|uniref:hypothetical protein n=1 Tax=Tenacibaculum xiamenense TaxID=1261553 RepID=UPI003893EF1D
MATRVIKGAHFGNVKSLTNADTKKLLQTTSDRPLAPTDVSATSNGKKGNETRITLMCTIYVSEANMPKNENGKNNYTEKIKFNISYSVDNDDKVTIYVGRNNKFIPSDTFYAYVVPIGFSPKDMPGLNNSFTTVEVINWDEDPEGSRGTTTTVQRPS